MKTKHQPLLRWPQRLVRAAAWAVLLTFSANIVTPTLVMAREAERRAELTAGPKRTEFDDVTDTLIQLEEALQRMNRRLQGGWEFEWQEIANRGGQTPPPAAADRAALRALEDELDAAVPRLESLQGHVRAFFAQTRKHIQDTNLAPEILARHDDSVSEYEASYGQLKSLLHAIKTAHTLDEFKAAVAAGDAFMQSHSSKPKRSTFDPNAPLAFGPGKNKAPEPRTDAKAMRKALGIAEPTAKALARQADMKAAPTAAELAETEDAQFTAAIRAKAQELGNNPVAIYNFVRNSVEFMPTYGSIQGADQTLKTLRGNAFDQSSLLIALLRAANIPARYVYGTIEVPIEQVQNWVGDTDTPLAALELLGAGGIPNLGLAQGGVIKKARIEHVWVEAFVDFVPSRGAKNIAGDTWVPMDAAFKQYDYTQGMQLAENVAFDAVAFANHINSTSSSNSAEGWIQGVDQAFIGERIGDYRTRLESFINEADEDATLDAVIGKKTVRAETVSLLSGALPNPVIATASRTTLIAASLRWKFRFELNGQVMLERGLPLLLGNTLALSFKPATQADGAAIDSLLPPSLDGPEDLPTSIPTSLARLVGELTVNGSTIAQSSAHQLGTELMTRKGLFIPGKGWQLTENPLSVGDYQAIGVDATGASKAALEDQIAALDATAAKLARHELGGITKHDVTGAMLQASVLSYFVQTFTKTQIASKAGDVISYRQPSYGTVATQSQVQYWFGVPRNFVPKGVLMDMDRVASIAVSKDGDLSKWKNFNERVGSLLSAHEHLVLEEFFNDRDAATPAIDGLSAIKAVAVAASQGQRIYTIDSSNLATALSSIQLPAELEREIADAVGAGKIVSTHQSPLHAAGQVTSGYIILDAETGAGAYKINSGADGSFITGLLLGAAIGFALLLAIVSGPGFIIAVAAMDALILAIVGTTLGGLLGALLLGQAGNTDTDCFLTGILIGFALTIGLVAGGVGIAAGFFVDNILIEALNLPGILQCTGWKPR
jgi:hypothetical protein